MTFKVSCVGFILLTFTLFKKTASLPESSNNRNEYDACIDDNINKFEKNNPFKDLSSQEIIDIEHFLISRTNFQIKLEDDAIATSNIIISMELLRPNKMETLNFLDSKGQLPERWARVLICIRNSSEPSYQEIKVGPLHKPSQYSILHLNGQKRIVPYEFGPILKYELEAIGKFLVNELESNARELLMASFNATFTNCLNRCLDWFETPLPSWAYRQKRRLLWARITHNILMNTVNPLELYVLLDISSPDPSNIVIVSIYYNKQIFSSLQQLMNAYKTGNLHVLSNPFPKYDENYYSSVNLRGSTFPNCSKRPPKPYNPDGPRFSVYNQQVEYMLWKFKYRLSPFTGIQLYDISYGNRRIVYELSLQELGVFYSGISPVSWFSDFVDSMHFLGATSKSLVPGIDCPNNAVFLPARISVWPHLNELRERVFCLFEHDNGIPLRRHNAFETFKTYTGLVDYVLILRTIITPDNYDYIVDFIFHADGVIETRLASTGYIIAEAYNSGDGEKFGFRLHKNIIGSIHHHVFHFKVDVDINGVSNRFESIDLTISKIKNPYSNNKNSSFYFQTKMERNLKKTEIEAAYKYNFDTPKYLIFHNRNFSSKYGNPRSYRLINLGNSKQLLPEGRGNEGAMSWSRYQVAVTKYKEDEPESSSIYNVYAVSDPVVDFYQMINDNDSLVDEDLVGWVSMGLHHIPHAEDLPHTTTTGAKVSMLLQPYNFFTEDPSVGSKDSKRIETID